MLKEGEYKQIQSYKHDGRLHRIWQSSKVLFENKEYIITGNIKTKVIEHDGRTWYSKEPAIGYFSKTNWYNVIFMFKETNITYYVNIASPTLYDEEAIKYIDYDLDVKVIDGEIRILDEKEFNDHALKMNYPEIIKNKVLDTLRDVILLIETKSIPFNDDFVVKYYNKL
ncbi:DUF402 domain-containing protein [Acholeplasma sp. OttesenSCG-928-E16]|nr:DUF402 domain-containing protein [Acholeplasma sp. OttesenSCG-928-E16]